MLLPLLLLFLQQVADTEFRPRIENPRWADGKGPVLALDEAHHNFHTVDGRYTTFAGLARRDGFVVKANKQPFSAEALRDVRILVIANALHASNAESWRPPNPPAFAQNEVHAVKTWVAKGGSLFLIADHQPFPAAASTLAAAFGIQVHNGYALDGDPLAGVLRFRLVDGPIVTFGGSAFTLPKGSTSILRLSEKAISRTVPNPGTSDVGRAVDSQSVSGWSQGGTLEFGKGRVAMFGEAAMFSAQLAGPDKRPMGMNHPEATGNPLLLLRMLHWLAGVD